MVLGHTQVGVKSSPKVLLFVRQISYLLPGISKMTMVLRLEENLASLELHWSVHLLAFP